MLQTKQSINILLRNLKKRVVKVRKIIEFSNNIQIVYKIIEDYYPSRKCTIFIGFDEVITGMINNKKVK